MKDWRTRWRRRPAWGWTPEPGHWRVGFILWDQFRKGKLPPRKLKKKTFEELISKKEPFPEGEEEKICDKCDYEVFKPLGLPVCPETAYGSTIHQEALLQSEIKEGGKTIPEVLDWLDWDLQEEEDGWEKLSDEDKEEWVMDQTTLEFLLLDGRRTLDEGVARIREARHGFGRLWGLPQEELHNKDLLAKEYFAKMGQPVPKNKIGRNDACPCGSSKKFKKCCGGGIT
ncbi:MAG: SEC-C domain-containing protein [Elusimicrobia bacterium]|nr:SEC-C domain-containing protein [Elusimicrobiota bacterium]